MIIVHISDTHSKPSIVKAVEGVVCDVIVITGDILANRGRLPTFSGGWGMTGPSYRIDPAAERKYQRSWFRPHAKKWATSFQGRPVVYVPGNHDFISIEPWLRHYGHQEVYTLSAEQRFVDIQGKRFAGFREIPWIDGEWVGETRDFQALIRDSLACRPDILVTHAPPAGILAGSCGYGIQGLTSALMYGEHQATHHLFGHEHSEGGQIVVEGGITFSNAAGGMNILQVLPTSW